MEEFQRIQGRSIQIDVDVDQGEAAVGERGKACRDPPLMEAAVGKPREIPARLLLLDREIAFRPGLETHPRLVFVTRGGESVERIEDMVRSAGVADGLQQEERTLAEPHPALGGVSRNLLVRDDSPDRVKEVAAVGGNSGCVAPFRMQSPERLG